VSRGAAILAAFVLLIAVSGCSGEKASAHPVASASPPVFEPDNGVCHETASGQRQVSRTASLRDELRKPSSTLVLRCFVTTPFSADKIKDTAATPCGKKHQAEFAGVWTAPETSAAAIAKNDKPVVAGCLHVIGKFTHLSDKQIAKGDAGWLYFLPTDEEWQQGERGVRCFVYSDHEPITGSVKGIGPAALGVA
jgi:hypothetical protein